MRRIRRLSLIPILLIAVFFFMPARAALGYDLMDTDRDNSLTVELTSSDPDTLAVAGAEVTIYLVAEVDETSSSLSYKLTDEFASSGIKVNDNITQSMIDTAAEYAAENGLKGITKTSDNNGDVVFDGLTCGIYLVTETATPEGFTSFVPFMYFLPFYSTDDGGWVYDAVAVPKIEYLKPVDVSVRVVWNDDGKDRPDHITVNLENEDGIYDTVKLNEANKWKHVWTGLDPSKTWNVVETDVPPDYKVTYSSEGLDFVVTNTKKLIQTGQTNWPIPVLILAGSFLVCAGVIIRITGNRKDEE